MDLVADLIKILRFGKQATVADASAGQEEGRTYGTFFGVYLPSVLSILA